MKISTFKEQASRNTSLVLTLIRSETIKKGRENSSAYWLHSAHPVSAQQALDREVIFTT